MATDAQRKLMKIHKHLEFMLRLTRQLRDEPLSIFKQAEAIERLETHAKYAYARFGSIVEQETSILDRMAIEYEPYAQPKHLGKEI